MNSLPPKGAVRRRSLPLFLVELRVAPVMSSDAAPTYWALRRAVVRLRSQGVALQWRCAVFVPADCRWLCLVEAPDAAQVTAATQIAGILSATVREVAHLTETSTDT